MFTIDDKVLKRYGMYDKYDIATADTIVETPLIVDEAEAIESMCMKFRVGKFISDDEFEILPAIVYVRRIYNTEYECELNIPDMLLENGTRLADKIYGISDTIMEFFTRCHNLKDRLLLKAFKIVFYADNTHSNELTITNTKYSDEVDYVGVGYSLTDETIQIVLNILSSLENLVYFLKNEPQYSELVAKLVLSNITMRRIKLDNMQYIIIHIKGYAFHILDSSYNEVSIENSIIDRLLSKVSI